MRPNQAYHVLEEIRSSSGPCLRRKGIALSRNDSQTVKDVYQQWLLLLIDIGYLLPESLERDGTRLWADMVRADVFDLNSAFSECLQLVRVQITKGFKGLCMRISTHLYNIVKQDVLQSSQGDVLAASRLVQLFSYTGRLSLNDIDITQQLLGEYLEIEHNMLETFDENTIRSLNKIMRRWIGSYGPALIIPKHAQKGVAGLGRASIETKYNDLSTDGMLRYAFGEPWWVTPKEIQSSLERISATVFVPKSYKTFRTISMEPTTLMYFQQGVLDGIRETVRRNFELRSHIDFTDQSRNQLLAEIGSIDRTYATIDLSSASDSVSYELVKKIFKGTWLLRYVVTLRSSHTILPDGRYIALKKFAPMGSALCFPIETLIFAAICEFVTKGRDATERYSVYGDDIIVPTRYALKTMNVLSSLGFLVNKEKSFSDETCWFRESCGGEYCDGYDVTPMRISRKYASREQDVRIAKLVELANNAYKRGFKNLRYFFIAKLRSLKYIPLFATTSILSDSYTNYHAKVMWNTEGLQTFDIWVTTQRDKYKAEDLSKQDESIRYRNWLEIAARRDTRGRFDHIRNRSYRRWLEYDTGRIAFSGDLQPKICKPITETKGSWVAKPYESLDQAIVDSRQAIEKFLLDK